MGYLIACALILTALAFARLRPAPGPDDDGDVSGFAPGG
jgi:hypothetical protein